MLIIAGLIGFILLCISLLLVICSKLYRDNYKAKDLFYEASAISFACLIVWICLMLLLFPAF